MAKVLLSVRIPDDLMAEIDALSAKTCRDKTSVTIDLLERGLSSIGDNPLTTANYVTVENFESVIESLRKEFVGKDEKIKQLETENEDLKKDEPTE